MSFRYCTTYVAVTLILVLFVNIAYDWRTGNGKYTIISWKIVIAIILTTLPMTLLYSVVPLLSLTNFFKSQCFQLILSSSKSSIWMFVLHRSLYDTAVNFSGLLLPSVLYISYLFFFWEFSNFIFTIILLHPTSCSFWFPNVHQKCLLSAKRTFQETNRMLC